MTDDDYLLTIEIIPSYRVWFLEFSNVFGREFWDTLVELEKRCGGNTIQIDIVEPGSSYYGLSTSFRFNIDNDRMVYIKHMKNWPKEDAADAPIYRADILTWEGISGSWKAYGVRSYNLSVLVGLKSDAVMGMDDIETTVSMNVFHRASDLIFVRNEFSNEADFERLMNGIERHFML